LKVEAWWKKAHDKNLCGRIIKEAKVHTGLVTQKKKKETARNYLNWLFSWLITTI
jgi:hypothetical protein